MRVVTIVDTVHDREVIPDEVDEEIREVWADYALGNDFYYLRSDYILTSNEEDGQYPNITKWLKETFPEPDNVMIHFWW